MVHSLPLVGSISGPHLPLPPPKKQQNNKTAKHITKRGEKFFQERFKQRVLKQTSWVNKWSTCAFKHLSQNADHLLTLVWTTYWPSFWHPQKTMPNLAETHICSVFEETCKQQKSKNTIIFTFGNIIAPFDFTRKLFFLPPPFFCPLPLADSTT